MGKAQSQAYVFSGEKSTPKLFAADRGKGRPVKHAKTISPRRVIH